MDVGQGHRSTAAHEHRERRVSQLPTAERLCAVDRRWDRSRAGDARAAHIEERVARLRGPERVADRRELAAEPRELDRETLLLVVDASEPGVLSVALALEQRATVSERQQAAGGGERHGTLPGSQTIGEACVEVWRRGVTLMAPAKKWRRVRRSSTLTSFHVGPNRSPIRCDRLQIRSTDSAASPQNLPTDSVAGHRRICRRFGPTELTG